MKDIKYTPEVIYGKWDLPGSLIVTNFSGFTFNIVIFVDLCYNNFKVLTKKTIQYWLAFIQIGANATLEAPFSCEYALPISEGGILKFKPAVRYCPNL